LGARRPLLDWKAGRPSRSPRSPKVYQARADAGKHL